MSEINRIEELKNRLEDFQEYVINQMYAHLEEYDKDNKEDIAIKIEKCPKCGRNHPHIVKGGNTKGDKQLLLCKECGKKFVSDYYEVTFHFPTIKGTMEPGNQEHRHGRQVYVTAEKCDVRIETAFKMRHKIMTLFEKNEDSVMVGDAVELDETYVLESQKGETNCSS